MTNKWKPPEPIMYDSHSSRRSSVTSTDKSDSGSRNGRDHKTMVWVDVVVALCMLVSLGLQLSGILVPGWWVLPSQHDQSHHINVSYTTTTTTTFGLWTVITCKDGKACTEREANTSKANAWLQVTQVFESGAVGFGVLALLCYVMASVKGRLEMFLMLRRLSVFLLSASAASIIIGMAVFLKKSAGLTRYPERTTAGGHLDWPIFLSMSSAVTCIVLAVSIGVCLHRYNRE